MEVRISYGEDGLDIEGWITDEDFIKAGFANREEVEATLRARTFPPEITAQYNIVQYTIRKTIRQNMMVDVAFYPSRTLASFKVKHEEKTPAAD